jgi:hypothetical protein
VVPCGVNVAQPRGSLLRVQATATTAPAVRAEARVWNLVREMEVVEEYKLVPDTLYLTMAYIDRFLSCNTVLQQAAKGGAGDGSAARPVDNTYGGLISKPVGVLSARRLAFKLYER